MTIRKETCLREVLADLRPNKKALADFAEVFGADPAAADAGKVTRAWRRKHVLARADIEISSGTMARLEPAGEIVPLAGDVAELAAVCREYSLRLA